MAAALQRFGFYHLGLRIFLHDLMEGILELLFIQKVYVGFIPFQFLATTFDNTLVLCLYHVGEATGRGDFDLEGESAASHRHRDSCGGIISRAPLVAQFVRKCTLLAFPRLLLLLLLFKDAGKILGSYRGLLGYVSAL